MRSRDWEGSEALRGQFLLDPRVAFLNHGSFGACPLSVLERQSDLRHELEREPVSFLHRELPARLAEARTALAGFIGCAASDLAFTGNVTTALNIVIRSLPLQPGDEILCCDHEYGALVRAWEAEGRRRGLVPKPVHLHLPVENDAAVVAAFTAAIGERTRALFASHVTSATALRLPHEQLIALARRHGALSIIDGAHAPGLLPLDLKALDADVYAGNCHKWLMAPKGCGFLHVKPQAQSWIEPLVTSWGNTNRASRLGNFLDELEWAGTGDPTAALCLPAALAFRETWDWEFRSRLCRERLQQWADHACDTLGLLRLTPRDESLQMLILGLPGLPATEAESLHERLFTEDKIEAPVMSIQGQALIRLTLQPYNRESDLERLEAALRRLLPRV